MLYRSGYAETMIGQSRRLLTKPELVQADRYFWNFAYETSIVDKPSARNAMGESLNDHRLTIEMLPKAVSFGHPGNIPSSSGEPSKKNQTVPKRHQETHARPKRKYLIDGWIYRTPLSKIRIRPQARKKSRPIV